MQTRERAAHTTDENHEQQAVVSNAAVDMDSVKQAVNTGLKRKLSKTDSQSVLPEPAKDNKENSAKKPKPTEGSRPAAAKMLPAKSTTDAPSIETPPLTPKQGGRSVKNAAKKAHAKPVAAAHQPTIQDALKAVASLTTDKKEQAAVSKPGILEKPCADTAVGEKTKPDVSGVAKDKKEDTAKGKEGRPKKNVSVKTAAVGETKPDAPLVTKGKKEETAKGKQGQAKKNALAETTASVGEMKPDAPLVTKDKKEETAKGKQGQTKKNALAETTAAVGETKPDAPLVTKDKKEEIAKGKQGRPKKSASSVTIPVGEAKPDAPLVTKDNKKETLKDKLERPKKNASAEASVVGDTKRHAQSKTADEKQDTTKPPSGSPKKTVVTARITGLDSASSESAVQGTLDHTRKRDPLASHTKADTVTPDPAAEIRGSHEKTVKGKRGPMKKAPADAAAAPEKAANADKDAMKKKRMLSIEKAATKEAKKAKKQDTRTSLWDKAALIADVDGFTVVCELKMNDGVQMPHAVIYRKDNPAVISLEKARAEHPSVGEKYDALEKEARTRFSLGSRS